MHAVAPNESLAFLRCNEGNLDERKFARFAFDVSYLIILLFESSINPFPIFLSSSIAYFLLAQIISQTNFLGSSFNFVNFPKNIYNLLCNSFS